MLPKLTPLQYLILCWLLSGELGAKDLQEAMREQGVRKSSPAFYQLMTRLDEKGYIESRWVGVEGRRMRSYKITGTGSTAIDETMQYYAGLPKSHVSSPA